VSVMSEELELLPEGFVTCPKCNRDDRIALFDVYTQVDRKIDYDSGLPNVYIVSTVKCLYCDLLFDLERIDVRFAFSEITEISFGEFAAYTTLPIKQAIQKATKWYRERFDDKLDEPTIKSVGRIIYTTDTRDIESESN